MDILKNRNFLLLFLGRIFTNIGDSLYYVAAMWLVYKLSGNPFYSGLAGFLTLLPSALQFLTGPFVDRWPIKNTLVITQVLQCILILIIPITHYFDLLTVQLLLIIMPIVAFIEQFAYPAQSKALPLLLHKTQLLKGNSLFSFAYQGIDLICTTLSGILVALFGAITLYVIDSFTFAITALLFFSLKIPKQTETGTTLSTKQYFSDLKEGFSIVFRSLMGGFLIGSVVANFSIGMTMAILPSFADSLGGVKSYGFFLAAISAGSLIGALFSSWVGKRNVGRVSIIGFSTGATFWFLSTIVPFQWLSILLFGLAWIPIGATNILFATISQIVIPNQYIGRINSVMRSMSTIAMPIGSLIGGYTANVFSSQLIFALASIGILFISLVWLLHPKLRALPKADEITADTFWVQFKEERGKGAAL
ncbi:transporter, MFS 1 family [Bacillus thuringiensis serovar tolworthi]|uniref:Transporter, MFS 1 family n=1 Tax=Bacillus thuringiensis subsp. tolworthi TaxID=1442 RepID=A0A9W3ZWF3_BACTO|nr:MULTISPECIES: MFS transporter [Bacillus cereus group]MEB8714063.1 MFS transporter [Bacillus cereus]MRB01729.1 MFS transporter [Bacillus thuringiensis]MEB9435300.1 MFS transporter [Bacillus cereus]MEB9479808.1 MFS transporter [Bacillus cereus]MEB9594398.1 MFS transporter [Bacillus cereus]